MCVAHTHSASFRVTGSVCQKMHITARNYTNQQAEIRKYTF
jgi:hypothetical protein